MKKILFLFLSFYFITGCSTLNKKLKLDEAPKDLIMVNISEENLTYANRVQISTYQNEPNLRKFYLVYIYKEPTQFQKKPAKYTYSSRITYVVNCLDSTFSSFNHIFYDDFWGKGNAIIKSANIGQWESAPKSSLIEKITQITCDISIENLKPEITDDSPETLLGVY
ncbi:surface-adhesin E family protein [Proteus sp. FME41]|uniref:surface-adhesin E family protein n=1 Tax=Proteus sp. FME41 TaxID=2742608 RepID=UPI001868C879|nr:surface-adhesin E family protein [Proteus sp. FME41]